MYKSKKSIRLGEEKYNNQGCLMKIVEYNNSNDITIEFQDKYKARTHTNYNNFSLAKPKNPYYPSVCGVGAIGVKYPVSVNGKITKEYNAWSNILQRCFNEEFVKAHPTYKDATCCKEWLLYENFYEWLHSQPNFDKWYVGKKWAVDKDIIVKGNKLYSPETCCLVPMNVNCLFLKSNVIRGDLPIGVVKHDNWFLAECTSQITNKLESLGLYSTATEAFKAYKNKKEEIIKEVAEVEYSKGNISKQCYKAMLDYEVEIDD